MPFRSERSEESIWIILPRHGGEHPLGSFAPLRMTEEMNVGVFRIRIAQEYI
jgi:hypothetical protein